MFTPKEYKEFKKLLKPYNENKRTVEKQFVWLKERYGFSDDVIVSAMRSVYREVKKGTKFEDGHCLDRRLLEACDDFKLKGIALNIVTDIGWWRRTWKSLNRPRGYFKNELP
jgi:hypothetical protein